MLVFTDQPDVTGVYECSPVQVAQDRETIFEVGFELQVAGLVEVAVSSLFGKVTARADRTDRKGTQTVGSPDIKLFAIGSNPGVPVTVDGTRHHASDQMLVMADLIIVAYLGCPFYELGKLVSQQMFPFFVAEKRTVSFPILNPRETVFPCT